MATVIAVSVFNADSLKIVEGPAGTRQSIGGASNPYAIDCNQELFPQLIKSLPPSAHTFCVLNFVFM
jgi:hypothetical protein